MTVEPQRVGDTARRALLAAVVATIALYVVPGGDVVARPLVWVATLAHELGHAAATAAIGGEVGSVQVFSDGSGVMTGTAPAGRLRAAAVAAGGLLGPAAVAALVFALSGRSRTARIAAGALGGALLLTLPFALRGVLAVIVGAVVGGMLVLAALRAPPAMTQVLLVFFAIQLSLSVFSRGDYLFTDTAVTVAGAQPSDSAQMAGALFGPYWLWGALCGLASVVVLGVGIVTFLHRARRPQVAAEARRRHSRQEDR